MWLVFFQGFEPRGTELSDRLNAYTNLVDDPQLSAQPRAAVVQAANNQLTVVDMGPPNATATPYTLHTSDARFTRDARLTSNTRFTPDAGSTIKAGYRQEDAHTGQDSRFAQDARTVRRSQMSGSRHRWNLDAVATAHPDHLLYPDHLNHPNHPKTGDDWPTRHRRAGTRKHFFCDIPGEICGVIFTKLNCIKDTLTYSMHFKVTRARFGHEHGEKSKLSLKV